MIILIAGASHTGKTALAQRLLEKYHYPYLSMDLLKMGLIRSGNTGLTPGEMIKTAIENRQNLVVEGIYIPFDWENDFGVEYRNEIRFYCLVMTEAYIKARFDDIKQYANVIETRLDDSYCTEASVLQENAHNLEMCRKYSCNCILIDGDYQVDIGI